MSRFKMSNKSVEDPSLVLLGGKKKGLLFVVSAPAGTGKTTLVRMLVREFPCIVESVSYTTRSPRANEESGIDYYYISHQEFEKRIRSGDFLEYAEVFGQCYGTSKETVEKELGAGKHVILVIDTQGALQLMEHTQAIFTFISPPSIQELRSRLMKRKSESKESLESRLSWSQKEIAFASFYDYHIVNDSLQTSYEILRSILIAEEHKVRSL